MIAALGLPITCGVGNVAILSSVFAAPFGEREPGRLKVLAHYQTITPYRHPAKTRGGPVPRIWIGDEEVADVQTATRAVKLTPEPVIDVSGACGVPLMLAMASGEDWRGHAPGPGGRPGGYPVRYANGALQLDLPRGIGEAEAIAWNQKFEEENGLSVGNDGRVQYAGKLRDQLSTISPDLANGFAISDIDDVFAEMEALRKRLTGMPEQAWR